MSFELTGKLIEKFDVVQVSDTFRKREFVIEKTENQGGMEFTDHIKFQLTQDRCNLLDNLNLQDEIRVNFNIRGRRWVRICSKCMTYSKKRGYREGLNNLTFRAVDYFGNEMFVQRTFSLDTKKPRIHRTAPRRGFASGDFYVQYSEDNIKEATLYYGNTETGFRNKSSTNCSSGKKQWCSVEVNLTDYNGQRIEYYFILEDVVGNSKKSQIKPDNAWKENLSLTDLSYFNSKASTLNALLGYE